MAPRIGMLERTTTRAPGRRPVARRWTRSSTRVVSGLTTSRGAAYMDGARVAVSPASARSTARTASDLQTRGTIMSRDAWREARGETMPHPYAGWSATRPATTPSGAEQQALQGSTRSDGTPHRIPYARGTPAARSAVRRTPSRRTALAGAARPRGVYLDVSLPPALPPLAGRTGDGIRAPTPPRACGISTAGVDPAGRHDRARGRLRVGGRLRARVQGAVRGIPTRVPGAMGGVERAGRAADEATAGARLGCAERDVGRCAGSRARHPARCVVPDRTAAPRAVSGGVANVGGARRVGGARGAGTARGTAHRHLARRPRDGGGVEDPLRRLLRGGRRGVDRHACARATAAALARDARRGIRGDDPRGRVRRARRRVPAAVHRLASAQRVVSGRCAGGGMVSQLATRGGGERASHGVAAAARVSAGAPSRIEPSLLDRRPARAPSGSIALWCPPRRTGM